MNELNKTLAFVGVAAVLAGTTVFATWPRAATPEAFQDQGQAFFPEFQDPEAAISLEVVEPDLAAEEIRPFQVKLSNGKWVIPSHGDYPADAKDRLARAARGVLGLTKDVISSDRPEDHKELGVVDPLDKKATSLDGMGRRVTLKDQSGGVLADLILGKEVPAAAAARETTTSTGREVKRARLRYVRLPGQNRTYAAEVKAEPSTRFADWIETNLLGIDTAKARRVIFDNTKLDPARKRIIPGETLAIDRRGSGAPWTLPDLKDGQEVNPDKTSALLSALGDLKIVGVRPKPPGLTADLKEADGKLSKDATTILSLASKGFHIIQGQLRSNEGDVMVATDEGVVYALRFGKVTFAEGETLSSGTGETVDEAKAKAELEGTAPGDDPAKKAEEPPAPAGAVESRYLFAMAYFDPQYIPEENPFKAAAQGRPDEAAELPVDPFQRTAEETAAEAKARQEKIKAGEEKVKKLNSRFAAWYYVVPGTAYRSLVLDRAALVRDKPATPPAGAGAGNPFGGSGGLPPGFPPAGGLSPH